MREYVSQCFFQFQCDKGIVFIEGPVAGEYLENLEFDENLNNFRKAPKQKTSLCEIAGSPDGMIYIARSLDTVVGYVSFHNPDPYTRWSIHPLVLELGAIEISPQWRKCRLGRNLLRGAFSNPLMQSRIVITMEYCWHWDLEGNGLNLWSYQRMLTGLFGSAGLEKTSTNDPEIMEHPANILMARIGEDVPREYVEMFEALRFL